MLKINICWCLSKFIPKCWLNLFYFLPGQCFTFLYVSDRLRNTLSILFSYSLQISCVSNYRWKQSQNYETHCMSTLGHQSTEMYGIMSIDSSGDFRLVCLSPACPVHTVLEKLEKCVCVFVLFCFFLKVSLIWTASSPLSHNIPVREWVKRIQGTQCEWKLISVAMLY